MNAILNKHKNYVFKNVDQAINFIHEKMTA